MTESDALFIAKQAKELDEAKEEIKRLKAQISAAHRRFVCIGGPLNDNLLRYTPAQLKEWQDVLNCLEES